MTAAESRRVGERDFRSAAGAPPGARVPLPRTETVASGSEEVEIRWSPPEVDAVAEGLEYLGEAEGVCATRLFIKGEVVVYGFRIKDEAVNHSHASQVALDQWVQHGGIQSFVNHACYPECNLHPRERIDEDGVLVHDMVSIRDILPGTAVTFDYCMRNLKIEHFPPKCLCGGAQCRGQIRGWSALAPSERDLLRSFAVPYLKLWEETVESQNH